MVLLTGTSFGNTFFINPDVMGSSFLNVPKYLGTEVYMCYRLDGEILLK